MSNELPAVIYLQAYDQENKLLDWWDRTHCEDKINDTDVEYTRLLDGQVVIWESQINPQRAV